ncbi:MAG TPA: hypothetical protein VJ719_10475 [Chthoniobacterales bacterium]|nr:hypothetical protein [Chthoniobacterales bacterium]
MNSNNPEFIGEIARQIAAVSAFLGGFAATFLGILLQSQSSRRHVGLAAGAAAVASALFMVAVIAGTLVALAVSPAAPNNFATPEFVPWARRVFLVSFALGIYSNLLSLGLSGWIRSRWLGMVTSTAALLSGMVVFTFVRFG